MLGETIDSLPGEFTGGVGALGFEIPREAGARLVLLFEFLRLPDGVNEIGGLGGEIGSYLVELVVVRVIAKGLFRAFPGSRIIAASSRFPAPG